MGHKLRLICITALSVFITYSAKAEETVKLQLELPKPIKTGTPKPVRSKNLEREAVVPVIMVPTGTVNIAKGKPVTSSDDFPVIGELDYITDGDKEGEDGSFVELGPDVQWVQIDLGAQKQIFAVAVWHDFAQDCAFRDVIVQVADDAGFTENVRTIFNNDHDHSAGRGTGKDKEYLEVHKGKLFDAKGARGRYVRLYSNGSTASDMNRYIEVEVFGK